MALRRGTYTEIKTLQSAVSNPTLAVGETFGLSMEAGDDEGLNGGWEQLAVQVEGITVGTVVFQVTLDGATWYPVGLHSVADWSTVATQAVADGIWILQRPKGFTDFRANITVNTDATITVVAQAG